jgi:hypothetical protein
MVHNCEICGEPMPELESMFKFHGYSGPCPKPSTLQPHQVRVVIEKEELDKKIDALAEFIMVSPVFAALSVDEQARLLLQKGYMDKYTEVLGERIAAFKK